LATDADDDDSAAMAQRAAEEEEQQTRLQVGPQMVPHAGVKVFQ
jgi:hypothetical protein